MPIIVTTSDSTVTASSIITRALRLIGQINPGASATAGKWADLRSDGSNWIVVRAG